MGSLTNLSFYLTHLSLCPFDESSSTQESIPNKWGGHDFGWRKRRTTTLSWISCHIRRTTMGGNCTKWCFPRRTRNHPLDSVDLGDDGDDGDDGDEWVSELQERLLTDDDAFATSSNVIVQRILSPTTYADNALTYSQLLMHGSVIELNCGNSPTISEQDDLFATEQQHHYQHTPWTSTMTSRSPPA